MMGWMTEGWTILIILKDARTVGYCLFRRMSDEYFPHQVEIYVRQFFVNPQHRSRGIGQAAFQEIMREWLPADAQVMVDALETNPRGRRFWEKLGFRPQYTNLQRRVDDRGRAEE